MRTPRRLGLFFLLILGSSSARGGEGSSSVVGDLKIPSGPRVVYDYHFDRNAFADSVDLPGGLVALTLSGNLVRFDPVPRRPTREWFGPSPITCMAPGEFGKAVVGFEDGRVARLDPATLELQGLAALPGKPYWVGTKAVGGGVVAVIERWKWCDVTEDGLGQHGFPGPRGFGGVAGSRKTGRQEWRPYSEAHDLNSGRSCAIDGRASAVHLDRKDRAWLGYDMGEFGGWCRCVDLSDGRARVVRGAFDPADGRSAFRDRVLGFAELRDGRILALGGSMNDAGGIALYRVDGDKVEVVRDLEGGKVIPDGPEGLGPGMPDSPIVRFVEGRDPGSLLAISEDGTIYRTDATLRRWDEFRELKDTYSYPNARAIHVRDGGLLCATDRDGYVFVTATTDTRSPSTNQLGAEAVVGIEVTSEGTFFRDREGGSPWQFRDGRWTHEPIELPVGGIFDPPMFPGRDGAIYSIGGRFTIRWHEGRMENLGGPLPLRGHSPFATPDGTLWSAWGGGFEPVVLVPEAEAKRREPRGRLMRLVDGEWSKAADLPGVAGQDWQEAEYLEGGEMVLQEFECIRTRRADGAGFPVPIPAEGTYPIGGDLRVVNEVGPPWVIHDRNEEQLLGLDHNLEFQGIRFGALSISENGLPLRVYDAMPWSREDVLIATRKGLKLFDLFARKHRPAPLPSPDRPARHLARDGSGRLWLGGEGLWMVDAAGTLHDLAEVPMVGRSEVAALAADPGHRDGVIVSLGVRGVAFIRVETSP